MFVTVTAFVHLDLSKNMKNQEYEVSPCVFKWVVLETISCVLSLKGEKRNWVLLSFLIDCNGKHVKDVVNGYI